MHGTWRRIGEIGGRRVALVGALIAGVVASSGNAHAAGGPTCVVVGVEDAATLQLQCGGEPRTLRLASVRAPQPGNALGGGEPYGTQGRDLVRGWFVGRRVEVGGGTARLGGEDVRHGLLSLGLVEWTGSESTPADAPLRAAERDARLASRGLWSYDAWRRHQSTVREPLLVPGVPPLPASESLGAVAARYSRKSAAERRAAFDAAVSHLEALPAVTPAPAPAPAKGDRQAPRARRPRSSQPR
jgi:endonuclease YncB( thermonuclease family)